MILSINRSKINKRLKISNLSKKNLIKTLAALPKANKKDNKKVTKIETKKKVMQKDQQ